MHTRSTHVFLTAVVFTCRREESAMVLLMCSSGFVLEQYLYQVRTNHIAVSNDGSCCTESKPKQNGPHAHTQSSMTKDWSALATAMVVLNMFGNCFFFALGNSHVSRAGRTIAESY